MTEKDSNKQINSLFFEQGTELPKPNFNPLTSNSKHLTSTLEVVLERPVMRGIIVLGSLPRNKMNH